MNVSRTVLLLFAAVALLHAKGWSKEDAPKAPSVHISVEEGSGQLSDSVNALLKLAQPVIKPLLAKMREIAEGIDRDEAATANPDGAKIRSRRYHHNEAPIQFVAKTRDTISTWLIVVIVAGVVVALAFIAGFVVLIVCLVKRNNRSNPPPVAVAAQPPMNNPGESSPVQASPVQASPVQA